MSFTSCLPRLKWPYLVAALVVVTAALAFDRGASEPESIRHGGPDRLQPLDITASPGGTLVRLRAIGQTTSTAGVCSSASCPAGHTCSCTNLNSSLLARTSNYVGTLGGSLTVDTTATAPNGTGGTCMPAGGTLAITPPDDGVDGPGDSINLSVTGRSCDAPPNSGATIFSGSLQGTGGVLRNGTIAVSAVAGNITWNNDGAGNIHLFIDGSIWGCSSQPSDQGRLLKRSGGGIILRQASLSYRASGNSIPNLVCVSTFPHLDVYVEVRAKRPGTRGWEADQPGSALSRGTRKQQHPKARATFPAPDLLLL
jgi:hypothetical protein